MEKAQNTEKAMFGAGCFWGVEEHFRKIPGVLSTSVGYAGGSVENPSYEQVCTDKTGHAEVVHLEYDPARVSYDNLVELFFQMHDPTTMNRQGPDIGTQYRSAIFFYTDEQEKTAKSVKERLDASGKWKRPIVTEIVPAKPFFRAEEYHQRYLEKKGANVCH